MREAKEKLLLRIDAELPKIQTFAAMEASTGRLLLETLAYIVERLPE